MLDEIKSVFFIKFFFTYIKESKKLELVKYSKNIQDKININLINYKTLSGRYIIYEENNDVKEYSIHDNTLVYEGEYLKGKRNGKGREFNKNGKIIYEGEYLNGKRNGNGKEFDDYGDIFFEGEYLQGKKWNGHGYDQNNNIINKLKNGKGIIKKHNYSDILILEYVKGEINGKILEFYDTNQLKFEGEYINGKRWNGKGYDINSNVVYELKNGKGYVIEYDKYSSVLSKLSENDYIYGDKNGKGKDYNDNHIIFEGQYLNGLKNGKGKEYDKEGNLIFEGEYLYNYKIKGREYINGKLEYEGEYLFNKKWNGKGYDENGNIVYELKNGNGKVKEYYSLGKNIIFEGEYINGKKEGKGKEFFIDKGKKLIFEGLYKDGKRWTGIGYDINNNISYKLIEGKGIVNDYNYNDKYLIYQGEYLNGVKNGKGKIYSFIGLIFEGEFINGIIKGKGKEYENGEVIFDGEFLNGYRYGIGKEYDNGKLIFEGEYINGRRNGQGIEYFENNLMIEGEYLNGKKL